MYVKTKYNNHACIFRNDQSDRDDDHKTCIVSISIQEQCGLVGVALTSAAELGLENHCIGSNSKINE